MSEPPLPLESLCCSFLSLLSLCAVPLLSLWDFTCFPAVIPHRQGSCPAAGERPSPQRRIPLMTQPQAEAVSWIYFGYQSSSLLCCQFCTSNWEGSTWSLHQAAFPVQSHSRGIPGSSGRRLCGYCQECGQGLGVQRTDNPTTSPSSPHQSHCIELANPSAAGTWARDESTEPHWLCGNPSL